MNSSKTRTDLWTAAELALCSQPPAERTPGFSVKLKLCLAFNMLEGTTPIQRPCRAGWLGVPEVPVPFVTSQWDGFQNCTSQRLIFTTVDSCFFLNPVNIV